MSREFSNVESWLSDGIDLKRRLLHLDCEVDNESVGKLIRAVMLMEFYSYDEPITLRISTYGGDIYHAFALYDTLQDSPCPIHTYGSGPIMSAGLLLLLAGDVRDCSDNSRIMAHEASESSWDSRKTSELENDLAAQKDIESAMLDVFEEKTSHTRRWWAKTIKHKDVYINREKAQKIGIITE